MSDEVYNTDLSQSQELTHEQLQERNWRTVREENERLKKEAREENERLRREAEELRRELERKRGDDELVEYKQLREMQQRIEQQTIDLRLKSKYPDFDEIVNSQALKQLAEEDPEVAYSIDNTPDMYAKAVTAYKMLKARAPKPEVLPSEDDEYYEQNYYKPRSSNSLHPSDKPLSHANAFQKDLSPEMKKQLFNEMQQAIKNRN